MCDNGGAAPAAPIASVKGAANAANPRRDRLDLRTADAEPAAYFFGARGGVDQDPVGSDESADVVDREPTARRGQTPETTPQPILSTRSPRRGRRP